MAWRTSAWSVGACLQVTTGYIDRDGTVVLSGVGPALGGEASHSPAKPPASSTAASTSAGSEPVPQEEALIGREVAERFGVQVDPGGAVTAVRQSNARAAETTLTKVRERRPHPGELRALRAALEHYAPILGDRRNRSNRAGTEQEVTRFGTLSYGLKGRELDVGMGGEFIGSHKALILYATASIAKDFGGGMRELEGTAVHELAHGLLKYALPKFTKEFGSWGPDGKPRLRAGAEPPYGNATTSLADLEASIKASFLVPDAFAAASPKHAEAVAVLRQRHPEVFKRRPGELSGKAAARIARELKSALPEFARMVGAWTEDGWPAFAGEPPITRYGATNADEDLAETAKFYFLDRETLRAKAPRRDAFFDRLVADWTVSELGDVRRETPGDVWDRDRRERSRIMEDEAAGYAGPAPHIDYDPDGFAWVSPHRSAYTPTGELIPTDQRKCVSITVLTRPGTGCDVRTFPASQDAMSG